MSKPQQRELHRSRRAPTDRDSWEDPDLAREGTPREEGSRKPIPEGNKPGHRPPKDQDKPEALGGAGHGRPSDDPD